MLDADHAAHLAIVDPEAGQQIDGAIAHIFELAACWPTPYSWPTRCRRSTGRRRLVGGGGSAYPDARFLIDTEQRAISGGPSSNSMMATALVANSGSRSFIQVSTTVQANLVPLEDDADGAFTGTAQAKFGMGVHVLGQVLDAPVGLTLTRRVDLGWFLTGQHQQPGLDVSMVLTGRRTLGTVFESVQALCGETVAPEPDGAFGQTHVLRDGSIGLTSGDTQDDLAR